ncbi:MULTISPECIES: bifunctional adenosylcobinamide kinase/adenosylcobinamide-phosphate guanylyltransferase [Okeania]|uniref:Adenosylcobinamide kinase n=1 Tax=Okeania hirsuta TaxID=1458930 RepID=A0A3N6QXR9_9CYAN|nr:MULTISPECIES: bifunctional adenosylcobinamide kinase/adenosylcobinamide-phosphate guanylyltransferase [Okeania]NEP06806.1 bifunctional adenosylcobinamide kinase/adenosylcobinamide-phosphate guanylyltransferase [Okeania sp. SIO4D6]NEP74502.1 bifunctional adenosylcobinamide kinase/adenosylcobinamide-phosphate guanylyltransferase [Okeania sp. SIO2G5]NEP97198.1 bifunctional adenosylcobinamide kinase/adenosylcobinamide-phosphate guanylyltransferase [Okeania sp. SIO2F5]NEQ93317.1 bifunctional aden
MNSPQATSKKLILVTGPARSGKSEWAENLAISSHKQVIYIATSQVDGQDLEWQTRIEQHQNRRPPDWTTLEIPVKLSETLTTYAHQDCCILVDSLGTWLANILSQDEPAWNETLAALIEALLKASSDVILVGEETGWGVVPSFPIGRLFRDRLGHLIRRVGVISQSVYLVTGGHVLNLSALGTPLNI